jgi:hypothetical protein
MNFIDCPHRQTRRSRQPVASMVTQRARENMELYGNQEIIHTAVTRFSPQSQGQQH